MTVRRTLAELLRAADLLAEAAKDPGCFIRALFAEGHPEDALKLWTFNYRITQETHNYTRDFKTLSAALKGMHGSAGTALVSRDNGQSFVPLATGTTKVFATAVAGARDQVLLIGETGARALSLPAVK